MDNNTTTTASVAEACALGGGMSAPATSPERHLDPRVSLAAILLISVTVFSAPTVAVEVAAVGGCVLVALLGLVMGMFWTGPAGIALGGVVAEFALGAPAKRTTSRRVVAYVAFVVCFWAGQISLIYLSGQSYVDQCVAAGMTAEYGQQLVDFVYGPLVLAALAATVAGSTVGGLFGARVFKKHFARMGA